MEGGKRGGILQNGGGNCPPHVATLHVVARHGIYGATNSSTATDDTAMMARKAKEQKSDRECTFDDLIPRCSSKYVHHRNSSEKTVFHSQWHLRWVDSFQFWYSQVN